MDRIEQNQLEQEVMRIDQGGNAWLDTEEVPVEVKRPLDKVVPVRLSAEHWDALRREARELGVGPTTLVRMWVLEKLRDVRPVRGGGLTGRGRDERPPQPPPRPEHLPAPRGVR